MSKKKTKETATPNQGIGFGKGVCVGNFRLLQDTQGCWQQGDHRGSCGVKPKPVLERYDTMHDAYL